MPTPYLAEKMAAVITEATHVSLHTDAPGLTGANEVTGGSPAYARVEIASWVPGDEDGIYVATLTGGVFDVPADTEILWAGLWNGTQFLDATPLLISTAEQGTVTVTALLYAVTATP